MSDQSLDEKNLRAQIASFPIRIHVQMPTRLPQAVEGDEDPEERPATLEEIATLKQVRKNLHEELQKLMASIRRQLPGATLVVSNTMTVGNEIVEADFIDEAYSSLPRHAVEGTRRNVARLVVDRLAAARQRAIDGMGESGKSADHFPQTDHSVRERAEKLFGAGPSAKMATKRAPRQKKSSSSFKFES